MSEQNLSDQDLLNRMMGGDEAAFTALYRRRQPAVYRFALQMSGSRTTAEDVTQEVFMVLMREGRNFDPSRGSLPAFLYGIARNHVLRCLERDQLYVPAAEDPDGSGEEASGPAAADSALDDLLRNERVESVRGAVLGLPAHYREVLVLCDLHEMSYEQAAAVLGCAVGTVRSRLRRARGLLAEKLRTGSRKMNAAGCPI